MNRLLVGTRKGLFTLRIEAGADMVVDRVHFAGDAVSSVMVDHRDGSVHVGLGTGHYGAKLHRSDDGGVSFHEITTPSYPPRPDDADDVNAMAVPIVSVDLPSGLSADTHRLIGPCVDATLTVTFAAPKPPLVLPYINL